MPSPTPVAHELPLPARVVNGAGRALRGLGLELVELDVVRMRQAACELAQADDFGEPDFEPGLAQTVRDIRRAFGLSFDAEYEARILEYLRDNPQHKHGRHRYRAADFGLDEAEIAERFGPYLAKFPRAERRAG